jgi:CheY-like chemotaxis protein
MQQSTYDLVMCDFLMPVMDGFGVFRVSWRTREST